LLSCGTYLSALLSSGIASSHALITESLEGVSEHTAPSPRALQELNQKKLSQPRFAVFPDRPAHSSALFSRSSITAGTSSPSSLIPRRFPFISLTMAGDDFHSLHKASRFCLKFNLGSLSNVFGGARLTTSPLPSSSSHFIAQLNVVRQSSRNSCRPRDGSTICTQYAHGRGLTRYLLQYARTSLILPLANTNTNRNPTAPLVTVVPRTRQCVRLVSLARHGLLPPPPRSHVWDHFNPRP
jgi:hypothetical protein